ncbi:uncharacterized protein ASPGLDRAFT_832615 [Aspergillus glaucus CBS 516.65]|uniref:Myb-like domain-containing protein n=1 Tax=Aspergillus glaucus CBS 516.65 TaxID=1160497 RepID=A0A1L9VAC7_ASPGL|nr:hypothetical protein ASPGLDRAFT_832615 [Aspergillus glaucus CBS 516.65]OJJ80772.1 hypothetical protein ASPGLDRAFT_832615 [Aspergillus glaucus CBS 516.65]
MSFTAINGENIDPPFAKQDPDSNELTMTLVKEKDENDSPIPNQTPVPTPRKRTRNKTTTNDTTDESESEQNHEQTSPSKKPKPKSPSKSPTKRTPGLGPIPNSYEQASNEDKLLIRLKDENKPWTEITKALEDITGMTLGAGLRSRYARIKANLVGFEEGDGPILFELKKDIEDKQELEKWQRIAEGIEARSGNKYPITTLQKKFKELSKVNGGGAVAVKDGE